MIELLKSLLGLISVVLGIIVASLTILLVIRKKQFAKPELSFSFKLPSGSVSDEPPKYLRNLPISFIAIIPQERCSEPFVGWLLFLISNKGKEALRNVRIVLEYDKRFMIENRLMKSLCSFKPTIQKIENQKGKLSATIVKSRLTSQEIKKYIDGRDVSMVRDRAQIAYNITLVRPGEDLVCCDPLLFRKGLITGIDSLGFGDDGFAHIVKRIHDITTIQNFLVINAWAYAENHEKINKKVCVMRMASGIKPDGVLIEFGKTLWFGDFPKAGWYYYDIISGILLRKLKRIGRQNKELIKSELGLMEFVEHVRIQTARGKNYCVQIPDQSEIQYFAIKAPNCDYFNLPSQIDNFEKLMQWLGSVYAFPTKRKKSNKNGLKGSGYNV